MKIIMVANNLMIDNFYYLEDTNIEVKKKFRSLSSDGENIAQSFCDNLILNNVSKIYCDASSSCIESAKYLSKKLNLDQIISVKLHDCKIGDLKNKSIKMLGYFQEHDFNFKLENGESLNECGARIRKFINNVYDEDETICIYLPQRCILAFLIDYTEYDYNGEENIILSFNDEVVLESDNDQYDIISIDYQDGNIYNIKNEFYKTVDDFI